MGTIKSMFGGSANKKTADPERKSSWDHKDTHTESKLSLFATKKTSNAGVEQNIVIEEERIEINAEEMEKGLGGDKGCDSVSSRSS